MHLTQCEQEKLLIDVAADLARKHRGRGLKLNYPEAIAIALHANSIDVIYARPSGTCKNADFSNNRVDTLLFD